MTQCRTILFTMTKRDSVTCYFVGDWWYEIRRWGVMLRMNNVFQSNISYQYLKPAFLKTLTLASVIFGKAFSSIQEERLSRKKSSLDLLGNVSKDC